jgi:hypothetical protein
MKQYQPAMRDHGGGRVSFRGEEPVPETGRVGRGAVLELKTRPYSHRRAYVTLLQYKLRQNLLHTDNIRAAAEHCGTPITAPKMGKYHLPCGWLG